jgi:hypothetical protein
MLECWKEVHDVVGFRDGEESSNVVVAVLPSCHSLVYGMISA